MNRKTIDALLRQIEKQKQRIAKERDRLRELLHEAESIGEDCDEAIDLLDDAADALSKLL